MPGEGTLDVSVHGQAQVRPEGLAAQGNEQADEARGGKKETRTAVSTSVPIAFLPKHLRVFFIVVLKSAVVCLYWVFT